MLVLFGFATSLWLDTAMLCVEAETRVLCILLAVRNETGDPGPLMPQVPQQLLQESPCATFTRALSTRQTTSTSTERI